MCLALTNAFISDLILGRPWRTLYYLAMVLGMVLDWFSSPALFPPSISSSCWVCVFKLLCVFGRTHSLTRVCFSAVRAHSLDLIGFSISITRVYRHEFCIETNRCTCALLRLRCCVPCPAAAAAAADIQMRVSSLCPYPGCCDGLQGPEASACLAGVSAWARPPSASAGAQLDSQGPALCHGQAALARGGRCCWVRRWVRQGPAAKPTAECKAAIPSNSTERKARPRPATELRLVLALRHVRAWVSSLHRTCL